MALWRYIELKERKKRYKKYGYCFSNDDKKTGGNKNFALFIVCNLFHQQS